MMNPSQADAILFVGGLALITFTVFGGLLGGIRKTGGKVRADIFGLPELLMSLVLAGFFGGVAIKGLTRPPGDSAPKVTVDQVMPNAFFFVILFAGVVVFLQYRGIDLRRALGFDRVPVPRALAIGLGLILAAFPVVLCGSLVMQLVLQQGAQEQELVTLFKEVARASNQSGVAQIFFAGAVVAPVCEEFLFRGLFYTVFKRYVGPVVSALFTASLFAAFHLNLSALPSLFLLALCFTIAYESTGSLLVPITMHALFNASQLGFLYVHSKWALA